MPKPNDLSRSSFALDQDSTLIAVIFTAKANFMIQYFVSVSRKSFSHSLGQNRKSVTATRMSAFGGKASMTSTRRRRGMLTAADEGAAPEGPGMSLRPCPVASLRRRPPGPPRRSTQAGARDLNVAR